MKKALRLLTYDDVASITSLSKPTLNRYIKAGRFPKPVRINRTNAIRFKSTEIENWINGLGGCSHV